MEEGHDKWINRTISVLYRSGQRFFSQRLRELELPLEVGQLPFIMQVYRHPGITQDGIAMNAVMDKGTTARSIKQLEESGLIVREVDEKDRRVNHIYPTEKAYDIKKQVLDIIKDLHDVLYQGFSQDEIRYAISLLSRMKGNMAEYLKSDD